MPTAWAWDVPSCAEERCTVSSQHGCHGGWWCGISILFYCFHSAGVPASSVFPSPVSKGAFPHSFWSSLGTVAYRDMHPFHALPALLYRIPPHPTPSFFSHGVDFPNHGLFWMKLLCVSESPCMFPQPSVEFVE